jgi:hypothetical protein
MPKNHFLALLNIAGNRKKGVLQKAVVLRVKRKYILRRSVGEPDDT